MSPLAPLWVLAPVLGCSVESPTLISVYWWKMESLENEKDYNFLIQVTAHFVGGRSQECSAECPLMKACF